MQPDLKILFEPLIDDRLSLACCANHSALRISRWSVPLKRLLNPFDVESLDLSDV
jgi:hypothetical protein